MRAVASPARDGMRVIHVIQGQYGLSERPDELLSTILGSCVATCLCDGEAGIGGMNHFLLPGGNAARGNGSLKYGVHAMELLINALLRRGARRDRLRARVFGGANMVANLPPIGTANGEFALWFLRNEGIRCVEQCLGGRRARRVRYWPREDKVQMRFVESAPPEAVAPGLAGGDPPGANGGETTLF